MTSPTVIAEPPAPRVVPPRRLSWKRLGGKFLVFSVLAHVLFLSVATYFVVQTYSAKHKQTFTPMAKGPSASTRALEHKVQQKHQQAASAPPSARRVTSTSANAKVSLPAMPAMPSMTASLFPATISGMGSGGLAPGGLSGGAGGGTGGNGGGVNFFGVSSGGKGLTGTLYDLKQTAGRQPTGMTPAKYGRVVGSFVEGGFNIGALAGYYHGPKPLYTLQIAVPTIDANQGPAAFHLQNEVKPKMWLVHYKGTVVAPEDGRFHFVGAGDDLLLVRFNGQFVLDGCFFDITHFKPVANYLKTGFSNSKKGLVKGLAFEVKKGQSYPLEVVIGEQPGGRMGAALLIEKEGMYYPKSPTGVPLLPFFRMGSAEPPPGLLPPHGPAGLVWPATAAAAAATDSIFSH